MKFKITKLHAKLLASSFNEKEQDYQEIELEPVCDTAREAILLDQLKQEYYCKGYRDGYHNGEVDNIRKERDLKIGFYRPKPPCLNCRCNTFCTHCNRFCL